MNGMIGEKGYKGCKGFKGAPGLDVVSADLVYTAWGRSDCPGGDMLLHPGKAASPIHHNSGGAANFMCLPDTPQFSIDVDPMVIIEARTNGVKYNTVGGPLAGLSGMGVPCAVCTRPHATQIMIPGSAVCPNSDWSPIYNGYLMSARDSPSVALQDNTNAHYRTEYICVDDEAIGVSAGTATEAEIFHVHIDCTNGASLPCGESLNYPVTEPQLTCAVCSYTPPLPLP